MTQNNAEISQKLVNAKQALAAKRAAQGIGTGRERTSERVPPGQRVVDSSQDFPVLDLGVQPNIPATKWKLDVFGHCDNPFSLDFSGLEAIGIEDHVTDWHCVTTWSVLDMPWRGVPLHKLIARAQVKPDAAHVMFHSYDGYTTNVPLEDCMGDDCLLVTHWNGAPLERKHGGPVRGMIPHLYAWKSAKWVKGIEFMTQNERGFWEVRGYHNYGDPFREQRYSRDESPEDQ